MSHDPLVVAEDYVKGVGEAEGVYLVSTVDHESASLVETVSADEPAQALEERSCPHNVVCDHRVAVGQHELHVK